MTASSSTVPEAATAAPAPMRRPLVARLGVRLLHRALTPGWVRPTPAARVRGWSRLLALLAEPTLRDRLYVARRAALAPLRAWGKAGADVVRFGAAIEAESGVPMHVQRRHLWWLSVVHGLDAPTYVEYRLYHADRRRRAAGFLQEPEHTRVLRWLHRRDGDRDAEVFRDKSRFAEWCRAHALPSVSTILEFEGGDVVASTLDGDPAASLPHRDLFSKPNNATSGHGVERWEFVGTPDAPRWRASDGREHSAAELLAALAATSTALELREGRTSRRMLLQPCLRNHQALAGLTTGALCTARVLVYREPGGRARIVRAAFRLATGNAAADNYAVGGIVAPIDVRTGVLEPAIRRESGIVRPVERHPDTGNVIAGTQLPWWPEAVALAERGLDAAPRMPTIGWDVAFTDEGPVLVEGNMAPNPGIVQKPTGLPLSDTPLPAALDAHMRAAFGV